MPEKPESVPQIGDIPEAFREITAIEPQPRFKWQRWAWGLVGLAIALGLGLVVNGSWSANTAVPTLEPAFTPLVQPANGTLPGLNIAAPGALLGHLPYEEAPKEALRPIASDGSLQLRQAAANGFLDMAATARAAGVGLIPLSGFRSVTDQEYVFFGLKAERGQNTSQRAEVSAPPGYSEHHTGYAIDIGDGSRSDANLQIDFERTSAFQWLQQNAGYFSFELSFPQSNSQGVSYEPWHWRYVGDRHSLETFYRAKSLTGAPSP